MMSGDSWNSDWLPQVPCHSSHLADHRCLVIHHTWLITEPLFGGHYRTVLTSLTWRDSVLTAEATKAVIVSSDTRLTAIFNWSTGLLSLLIVSKIRVGDVLNQTNV